VQAQACYRLWRRGVVQFSLAGACVVIVTGDQDLLILDPFQGIRVLAPSGFWKWESTHDDQRDR
jgi:predicted nucleic acid-binding protein